MPWHLRSLDALQDSHSHHGLVTRANFQEQTLAKDAVWRAATYGADGDIEKTLKKTDADHDEALNTVRGLTKEEARKIGDQIEYQMGEYSVLLIAICRGLHSDVEYLLKQPAISLVATYGQDKRTALFEAVLRQDLDIVKQIVRCPSVAATQHINIGDVWGNTPLHRVMVNCDSSREKIEDGMMESGAETINIKILLELLPRGVNIDALNLAFRTPLHTLISKDMSAEKMKCVRLLLDEGAEVNTKDEYGDSPLHDACRSGNHELIHMLLECGADLDSRNLDWKTAQDLFGEHKKPLTKADHEFAAKEFSRLKKAATARRKVGNIPQHINHCTEEMRSICSEFPVYFRYQWAGYDPKADGSDSMSWVRTDLKVSQILYPSKEEDFSWSLDAVNGGQGFLSDCKKKFVEKVQDCLEEEQQEQARHSSLEANLQASGIPQVESPQTHLQGAKLERAIERGAWRWINFPSNNMTWMKDFVIHNARRADTNEVDRRMWQFFERSIQVHETNTSYTRVRIPHVHVGKSRDTVRTSNRERVDSGAKRSRSPESIRPRISRNNTGEQKGNDNSKLYSTQSWSNIDAFNKSKMLSLVIPYIDIETEDQVHSGLDQLTTQCERIKKLNQAYFPFTGMHGVQTAQTLDQTSYNTSDSDNILDSTTDLHSVENQVIYRWSKKRTDSRKEDNERLHMHQEQLQELQTQQKRERPSWKRHESQVSQIQLSHTEAGDIKPPRQGSWWKRLLSFFDREPQEQQNLPSTAPQVSHNDAVDPIRQERAGRLRASAPNAERIRQDLSPKWLMVRQVWLWKLDDNTILTAIPSRQNGMTADTLLETIRQGNLDVLKTPEDLVKRIVYDTVTFLDEFKWAGLGEHILDIFDKEIAAEMYQEAKFFQRFGQSTWSPAMVNASIQEAAQSIYLVKDIRDELRLIKQVLETQLKVVKDFAEIFWPPNHRLRVSEEQTTAKTLGESFIRDCGLEAMIARVKDMDEDASTTLHGLSNIIQAMQAQASLKEAEASRVMNLIILPFTIVTVIFTPLSFLTSLFAVNVLEFPTNEEGELRLPGSWVFWRVVVGEIISLVVVFLFVYYLYNREREASGARAIRKYGVEGVGRARTSFVSWKERSPQR